MTPRQRRLRADHEELAELARSGALEFDADGDPPERYQIVLRAQGLERERDGRVLLRAEHELSIALPLDYPRRPPLVVWCTPVFHPNLLSPERHGAVCLGSWSAGESLAALCLRLRDVVAYRSFNLEDPLDLDAAAWVREHSLLPGADLDALLAA